MKTFVTATESEIVSMVDAADNGWIDLYNDCGWRVGQERDVSLSAMEATAGVGESHIAQTVTFVLMNKGGKTLTTPVASGRTACSFIVGMKDCLNEKGYMNSVGPGWNWTSCNRRAWCNSTFKAALPETLLPAFKQFQNQTSQGYQKPSINTDDDYFALPSEIEISGSASGSYTGEGTQFTWYGTSSNRIKQVNRTNDTWWGRSPSNSIDVGCSYVNTSGVVQFNSGATVAHGISPFGVV